MPVTSYVSLSDIPALIGVACNPRAFTYLLITKCRLFSLCLLDLREKDAIAYLATHSGRESNNKLADAGLGHTKGARLDVPVIENAVASLECALLARKKFGDHVLIVGKVEEARAAADFLEYWRFKSYKPILYSGWPGRMATYSG
jgi:flavin reductase (DIM6/NTAB) family NADH-FMN oxidoreductase RutF